MRFKILKTYIIEKLAKQLTKQIYLDYNATTPIDPLVVKAMLPFLNKHFGNPSSTHKFGVITKIALEKARKQISKLINCQSEEIVFTSGGTESNNYALIGYALAHKKNGNHIITSQIEHPAVIEVCKYLHSIGFEITYLPVDKFGMVNHKNVQKNITSKTILISIMHANNEVGTIQPITEIGKIAKKNGICFHTDAAQSLGKISVDVKKMNVDLLSIAGHKIYAPKGVGALFIRDGINLKNILHGAGQEKGRRAGTENILEIVGLGEACELALKKSHNLEILREKLHQRILAITKIKLNGHPKMRLPNTLNISFEKFKIEQINKMFSKIAVSAGAACHSGNTKNSSVLQAMKIPISQAQKTVRFSVGRFTTEKEIDKTIKIISEIKNESSPK